jgi:hypothetical protein
VARLRVPRPPRMSAASRPARPFCEKLAQRSSIIAFMTSRGGPSWKYAAQLCVRCTGVHHRCIASPRLKPGLAGLSWRGAAFSCDAGVGSAFSSDASRRGSPTTCRWVMRSSEHSELPSWRDWRGSQSCS